MPGERAAMINNDYNAMLNGIAPSECICIMTREPRGWESYNGPEPAEWEQDPLCIVHPGTPGYCLDPIQSAPIGWHDRFKGNENNVIAF